jgi:nicotinate-nucleotide adenylyltransferase
LIGLFGGTFDPVHLGHLHAATSVCGALALPRLHLLLAARPGHRRKPFASVEHRWQMLQLACAADRRLVPDDREIRRAHRQDRPSWTVDTLEELRSEEPTEPLVWVVGSDAYAGLLSWHRWRDVLALAHLVVLKRPGAALVLPEPLASFTAERRVEALPPVLGGAIVFLDLPMRQISSTEVRAAVAAGLPTGSLLPAAVSTYIATHGLYGVRSDPGSTA